MDLSERAASAAHTSSASHAAHNLSAVLAYWGADERCRYVSDAYAGFLGRSAEEMRDTDLRTVLGSAYALNKPYIDRVLRGEAQEFEHIFPRAGGPEAELLTTYTPDIGADGAVRGFVAVITDVTGLKHRLNAQHREHERVMREQAERDYLERFKSVVDKLSIGVLLQGPRAEILISNPAAHTLLGLTEDQMRGRTSFDPSWNVIREDGSPFPGDQLPVPRAIAAGQPVRGAVLGVFRPVSQDYVWLHVDAEPQLDDAGVVTHALCTFVDITQRRNAEVALQQTQDRLQQAVRAAQVMLWDWDTVRNKIQYSPEWKRNIGYEDHEITDDSEEVHGRVHPEDMQRADAELSAFVRGEVETYQSGFRLRHRDGSYRHVLARATRILDRDGRLVRITGANVDLTERTELLHQLLQAQKMESVGRLAGGIAHDFNNLLMVINATAELALQRNPDDQLLKGDLEDIHTAGERAAALTQQLLAFSRKQILAPKLLRVNSIVTAMHRMLRRLVSENITLRLELNPDAGNVLVDRGQLEQIIMNLVVNAADAMPGGGVLTISTDEGHAEEPQGPASARGAPARQVLLRIHDTGQGMTEATRRRVFEPFFGTKGPGTGLGLATVYGIVKQSGGTISLESAPYKGTTFTIRLPRAEETKTARSRRAATLSSRGTETLLIVEDEQGVRMLLKRILAAAGYTLIVAENGEEALAQLAQHTGELHLLLTDLVMPGMNGRELSMRVAELRPKTRVLFMSGYTDDAIVRHGVSDDEAAFIGKPYTPDELTRKIRSVLDT